MSVRITTLIAFICVSGAAAPAALYRQPRIPFIFVENRGQTNPGVRYIGEGAELKAWFLDNGVVLRNASVVARISFEGAGGTQISSESPMAAKANYLIGRNPAGWLRDLPMYAGVRYTGVWPGVEVVYRAQGAGFQTTYITDPGADVARIHLRFDGDTRIQSDGRLVVSSAKGDMSLPPPLLLERTGHGQQQLLAQYRRQSDGSIGLAIVKPQITGEQNSASGPNILFSGYFGGSSEDNITAIAVDSLNNVVVAGWTSSTNLPTSNGYQKKYGGSVDAFVASFQPNGGTLNYCTYIGGSGNDEAFALAIDSSRNVYITGQTSSTNFPVLSPIKAHLGGTRDAFVAKLAAAGNTLLYSTYLGGSGVDVGYAIGLSAKTGNLIVAGDTTSIDFPVTAGVMQPQSGGGQDAFVATISPAGNSLVYSTYLGGSGIDHTSSVAVGPSGGIFVGGYTWSTNFPGAGAPRSSGGQYGFVVKIPAAESRLTWSTYIGGSGGSIGNPQEVTSVHVDSTINANIVVGGITGAPDFPVTPGAFQPALAGETDGFVAHLSNANGSILQATYLGGSLGDSVTGVTTDLYGDIYVTGATSSPDFPVQWPFQSANAGMMDAFVAKFNDSLSTLIFSTYIGGSGSDQANAIAVDAETSIIVAGQTGSENYPVTGSSLDNYMPSLLTSFITKIRPDFTLGVAYPNASQMEFTADPWHIMSDTASTYYGLSTDIPIAGDWTGTGVRRIGIFRNGTWILDTNGDGVLDAGDQTVSFGQAGDIPVVGDWRGTGHIALGLYRNGTFILDYSGHLSGVPTGMNDVTISNFGLSTDIPIVSDWSGSGTTKVGVFRNGAWLIDYNGTGVISQTYTYGQAGDIPVVGDWDSSHNPPKIGVYRSGIWVLNYTGNNVWGTPGLTEMSLGFGFPGYTPLIF